MRRAIALILLIVCLAPGTWWRVRPAAPSEEQELRFYELQIPPSAVLKSSLGPFVLEQVWRMESQHRFFGGYSALLPLGDGQLLALSDRATLLRFAPPGVPATEVFFARSLARRYWNKVGQDVESASTDASRKTVWIGLENSNSIVRNSLSAGGLSVEDIVWPPVMAGWGRNSGPESLVRLKDSRFIALREGFSDLAGRRWHAALLFAEDPVENQRASPFSLIGPPGFSPTDAAQMPDGRVLVLFRKLDWPLPARFSIRIGLGDPALIEPGKPWRVQQVAELPDSLPVDNFEGLAIEPRTDGRLTVWLISDDNGAAMQATYLWKFALDPADLPPERKRARGKPARLSKSLD